MGPLLGPWGVIPTPQHVWDDASAGIHQEAVFSRKGRLRRVRPVELPLYLELHGEDADSLRFVRKEVEFGLEDFRALTRLVRADSGDRSWLADLALFPADPQRPGSWQTAVVVTTPSESERGEVRVTEWTRGEELERAERWTPTNIQIVEEPLSGYETWYLWHEGERRPRVPVAEEHPFFCNSGAPEPSDPGLEDVRGVSLVKRP